MKRYIKCSSCGKKVYEDEQVFSVPGIIFRCCSLGCLANCMMNYRVNDLTDEYLKDCDEDWDGAEEYTIPNF